MLVYQERKKKQFYSNLNINAFTENKTAKPFLTDKTNKTSRITLKEVDRVISQDHLIEKTFSEYFISIPIKNMPKKQEYESFDSSEKDPVSIIIKKYQNHPSIKFIKIKSKKASQKSDMSTNILKKMQLFSPSISTMISIL